MTWTYDVSLISTSELFQLRLMIGDVDTTDQIFQDEELEYMITEEGSVLQAAIAACKAAAAMYAKTPDQKTAMVATWFSKRVDAFLALAKKYEDTLAKTGAIPYAGGISVADKDENEADADWAQGSFKIGQWDNE